MPLGFLIRKWLMEHKNLIKLPHPDFFGNAGQNIPGDREIRYKEFSEKVYEKK